MPKTQKSKSKSDRASTESSNNDLPPSCGYLISLDVPMKQFIVHKNDEIAEPEKKFIIRDLDSTHLLVKHEAKEEIEREVEEFQNENVFSAVERVGEDLDMS